jgi:hypothetical protein
MNLDDRLKKISTGVSVSDAIDAYLAEAGGEVDEAERAKNDELKAIVEVMFLMAAVDGEVADEELQQLRASLQALADIQDIELPIDDTLIELTDNLAKDGWKRRAEVAASRIQTAEGKAFAFRLAAGVAFVDDFVASAEAAGIDSLATALELSKDDAQQILREVHETLFGGG